MTLKIGKSPEAFSANVKTEVDASKGQRLKSSKTGKPMTKEERVKRAVAIAYAQKRKAK